MEQLLPLSRKASLAAPPHMCQFKCKCKCLFRDHLPSPSRCLVNDLESMVHGASFFAASEHGEAQPQPCAARQQPILLRVQHC